MKAPLFCFPSCCPLLPFFSGDPPLCHFNRPPLRRRAGTTRRISALTRGRGAWVFYQSVDSPGKVAIRCFLLPSLQPLPSPSSHFRTVAKVVDQGRGFQHTILSSRKHTPSRLFTTSPRTLLAGTRLLPSFISNPLKPRPPEGSSHPLHLFHCPPSLF